MIVAEGKKIIDIVFYNTNNVQPLRIKKGITGKNEIVYDNVINKEEGVNIQTPQGVKVKQEHYLNMGDQGKYYIFIQGEPYLITDIECNSEGVTINDDSVVQYNNEGIYKIYLKYKSYTVTRNVFVSHLTFSLA